MCAAEGTRLASVRTAEEQNALLNWAYGPEILPNENDRTVRCIEMASW